MIKKWCRFLNINVSHQFLPQGSQITFVHRKQISIPNWSLFPIQVPSMNFRTVFSHKSPAIGCPCRLRSRGTTGSTMLFQDFGHWCIQTFGHSDFGYLSNFGASSISPGYRRILRLLLFRRIQVVEQWHPLLLHEPCSVNTSLAPESSFTTSLRSTTRPSYFWNWGSNSAFFRWHKSISDAMWTLIDVMLCLLDDLLFALDFF